MQWYRKDLGKIPVKSWCNQIESGALRQIQNLSNHPCVVKHIAIMPDCHVGYGMPIGAVIACKNAIIPNAVGVDIGCGVLAAKTNIHSEELDKTCIEKILSSLKRVIPVGEGRAHKTKQKWNAFDELKHLPGGINKDAWELASRNLGTLGGGNHFIEMQKADDGFVWLMIHSGSRNLGHRIAEFFHKRALENNLQNNEALPDKQLAFLYQDSKDGQNYIRDMNFSLEYARENRRRIMDAFKLQFQYYITDAKFAEEIDIHHNYASLENHFGEDLWIHRKGAISARKSEKGLIPGSMGTASYVVEGLGNPESFLSCSHGAGRMLGRAEACRTLDKDECEKAMQGIVFDGFPKRSAKFGKKSKSQFYDLEEAPQAYKNIEDVISSELDLIKTIVKLHPLGVIKG